MSSSPHANTEIGPVVPGVTVPADAIVAYGIGRTACPGPASYNVGDLTQVLTHMPLSHDAPVLITLSQLDGTRVTALLRQVAMDNPSSEHPSGAVRLDATVLGEANSLQLTTTPPAAGTSTEQPHT
ncbi:hypothetical protein [Saccharopolyspora griseoalba]|uniref:Uncharacterized protein n=1 Tax=Saccharopolyspora griseoalba TaxID=1431848 RepID=A0ABW2LPZ5_9PSEU